jgi:hypothetical protein
MNENGMEENYRMDEPDALGNYANDAPLNEYGFPCVYKENGKIDKSQSVCYLPVPMGFEYNVEWLQALQFNETEISVFSEVLYLIGRLTERRLASRVNLSTGQRYYTQGDISIILYMYNFCVKNSNSSLLQDSKFMSSHLNKLYNLRNTENPNSDRGSIAQMTRQILASFPKKFDRFPRRVEIVGIEDETFKIYNSDNYVKYDKLYTLQDGTNVGSDYITIITDKVPAIKWRGKKQVDDVCYLSLADSDTMGMETSKEALYLLKVNRDYVKFRPTFYIYLSSKEEPGIKVDGNVYNLNYYKIIGESGVIITVAIGVHQLGKHERNKIPASEYVQAIAYYPEEAYTKLMLVAKEVYANPKVRGMKVEPIKGNCSLEDFLEYSKNLSVEEREALEYEASHQDTD